jgi:CubicO group peptidase (beta-lactamase class C family)
MITFTKRLLIIGALTTVPMAANAQAGFSPQGLSRVKQWMAGEVDAKKIPGAIIYIHREGRPVMFEKFGMQDADKKIPMANDSIFRLASMTKPITSVAAMMLVEEGKLTLDTQLSTLIPAFKDMKVAVEGADGKVDMVQARRGITVHDLLRHTSGLTYGFFGNSAAKRAYLENKIDAGTLSNEEFANAIAKMPLGYHPGAAWDYSYSTDVLGRVVEIASGKKLSEVFNERIFKPLGMKNTMFYVTDPKQQAKIAEPFANDRAVGAGINLGDARIVQKAEAGGQGLSGSVEDYAKFLTMVLNGGYANGKRFLSPKTLEYMGADHLGAAAKTNLYLPGPGYGFGLGFATRTTTGEAATFANVGEINWGGAAGTAFWVDPKAKMFVILMMQSPKQRTLYRPILRNLVYGAMTR